MAGPVWDPPHLEESMVYRVKPPEVAEIERAKADHQFTIEMFHRGVGTREDIVLAQRDIYDAAAKHGYFIGPCESAFWRWQPWMEEPGYRTQKS